MDDRAFMAMEEAIAHVHKKFGLSFADTIDMLDSIKLAYQYEESKEMKHDEV